jgi:hypothetical protein
MLLLWGFPLDVSSVHFQGNPCHCGGSVGPQQYILIFSTRVFHKRHSRQILSLFWKTFCIFFGHYFCLLLWEQFHFFIACHGVLTRKEKMMSRKSKHLANYQMNGSLLPRNQASCHFLTACNFLIEAIWLLGVNEAIGNFENDEYCHVFKCELWNKTTVSCTLLFESESILKCPWGM